MGAEPVPSSADLADADRRFVIATAAAAALTGSDPDIPVTLTDADRLAVQRTVEAARLRAAVDALAFLSAAALLLEEEQARLDGALDSLDSQRARLGTHRDLLTAAADSLNRERARMFDYAGQFQRGRRADRRPPGQPDSRVRQLRLRPRRLPGAGTRPVGPPRAVERGTRPARQRKPVFRLGSRPVRPQHSGPTSTSYALVYVRKNMLDAFIDSFIEGPGRRELIEKGGPLAKQRTVTLAQLRNAFEDVVPGFYEAWRESENRGVPWKEPNPRRTYANHCERALTVCQAERQAAYGGRDIHFYNWGCVPLLAGRFESCDTAWADPEEQGSTQQPAGRMGRVFLRQGTPRLSNGGWPPWPYSGTSRSRRPPSCRPGKWIRAAMNEPLPVLPSSPSEVGRFLLFPFRLFGWWAQGQERGKVERAGQLGPRPLSQPGLLP